MTRIRKQWLWLAGVSALAVAAASASAQDKTSRKDDDATVVVVTAMKKSQTTLAVPAAVTALSGADLKAAGVNTVDDIQNIAPSVTISRNSFGVNTSIRGVAPAPNKNPAPGQSASMTPPRPQWVAPKL